MFKFQVKSAISVIEFCFSAILMLAFVFHLHLMNLLSRKSTSESFMVDFAVSVLA